MGTQPPKREERLKGPIAAMDNENSSDFEFSKGHPRIGGILS